MKYIGTFIICLLIGCVSTTEKVNVPSKDCIVMSPHSGLPIIIREGFFNDESAFMTPEEFTNAYNEYMKRQSGL